MAKIAYKEKRIDILGWNTLNASAVDANKKWVKEFGKEGQKCFIAVLHFDSLNYVTYLDVKKDVQIL